ncbi:MAG: glycosyltransferase [Alphaproteobacteria bacterium]
MRIIYVGNAALNYAGSRYYYHHRRFVNGLVRGGHDVWFFSDRDQFRAKFPLVRKRRAVNRDLVALAKNYEPEAVFLCSAEIITNDTLREIRAMLPALRIAQINVDAVYNDYNRRRFLARREVLDAQFFNTAGAAALSPFASDRAPCYFLPNLTDSGQDTGRAFDLDKPPYDLICTQSTDPRVPSDMEREKLALDIERALPGLVTCYRGFAGRPGLHGRAYIKATGESAMGLNLTKTASGGGESTLATRYLGTSSRLAHIMGNGALALIPDQFGLESMYRDGEDAVFFANAGDAIEKIGFYRSNPQARRSIARKGWEKAHGEFEGHIVMQYALARLMGHKLARDYIWPTEAVFDGARA